MMLHKGSQRVAQALSCRSLPVGRIICVLRQVGLYVSRVRAQGSTRPEAAESLIFFVAGYAIGRPLKPIVSNVVSIELLVD